MSPESRQEHEARPACCQKTLTTPGVSSPVVCECTRLWRVRGGRWVDEGEKCPGCDLLLPSDDLRAQKAHMDQHHPDIVAARLEKAGFRQRPDGSWLDTLVGAD